MKTFDYIKSNKKLIFERLHFLTFNESEANIAPQEIYKSYCTDQSKPLNFYTQNFNTFLLKQYDTVNTRIVTDSKLEDILSHLKILNVFYFDVWGSVIEHKDPPGHHLGYVNNVYKTVLMPIQIPSLDKSIFDTFYNKQSVELKEGELYEWDVTKIPHSWTFDYSKINQRFKLLHIDYVE